MARQIVAAEAVLACWKQVKLPLRQLYMAEAHELVLEVEFEVELVVEAVFVEFEVQLEAKYKVVFMLNAAAVTLVLFKIVLQ